MNLLNYKSALMTYELDITTWWFAYFLLVFINKMIEIEEETTSW